MEIAAGVILIHKFGNFPKALMVQRRWSMQFTDFLYGLQGIRPKWEQYCADSESLKGFTNKELDLVLNSKTHVDLLEYIKKQHHDFHLKNISDFIHLDAWHNLKKNLSSEISQRKDLGGKFIEPYPLWSFPKGKVEKKEDLKSAAIREFEEETQLKWSQNIKFLNDLSLQAKYPISQYYIGTISINDGELSLPIPTNFEIQLMEWVTVEEGTSRFLRSLESSFEIEIRKSKNNNYRLLVEERINLLKQAVETFKI
jgi:ADP-ribose pyrophosphatase YjhB (NUDIX family)